MCWCELSVIIPLYFEDKDLLKYVREFCKQCCVFPLSDPKIKMPGMKSGECERCYPQSNVTCTCATAPARNRNEKHVTHMTAGGPPAARASGVISKGKSVLAQGFEKGTSSALSAQCREAWSNLRKSGSLWHAPSSGRPWPESHQTRSVEFPNFVVPFMSLLSFLSQT